DVADLLARTEALRERSRGLRNLVAERRRGLERELAAVADEGVVETLVAEAARTREQLDAVDLDVRALTSARAETESAEVRAAEEGVERADAEWRLAAADASRWRARAETLALALDGTPSTTDVALDGMIGRLADHIEIEAGAEVAVAAALGDALQAVVVDG